MTVLLIRMLSFLLFLMRTMHTTVTLEEAIHKSISCTLDSLEKAVHDEVHETFCNAKSNMILETNTMQEYGDEHYNGDGDYSDYKKSENPSQSQEAKSAENVSDTQGLQNEESMTKRVFVLIVDILSGMLIFLFIILYGMLFYVCYIEGIEAFGTLAETSS